MDKPEKLEEILDLCIERLRKGESPDTILADYPEQREDLKPHLSLATSLLELPRLEPDASTMHRALFELGAASASARVKTRKTGIFRPVLAWAAGFLLLLGLFGYTTVNIAQASLPGDFLYPFKLATERVKLALIRSPESEVEMRITLSERRLQEVVAAAEQGQIYEAVLSAMLDEAQKALYNAEQLQMPVRNVMISRIQYLSGYQKKVLENLLPDIPADKRPSFQGAIRKCSERWNRCDEMGTRRGAPSPPGVTEENNCGRSRCN